GWPWWWMLGATAACTLAFPPGAKALRRRLRRSAWTDEPAVPAAWREALERLSEVGLRPATAETPFEFARRVATDRPATTLPMSGLATAISGYTYSPTTPTRSDGQAAWGEADQLSRALDEGQRAVSKVRRRLDPRPLLPPSLSWRRTPR
ncbi:MAG: DUF4129 domain-containing protein, partial [Acidimicrobiia bacterium]